MPGPPPKHPSARARRNNPKADFRVLSAKGRKGKTPAWPLADDLMLTSQLEFNRDRIVSLQVEFEQEEDGRARGRIRRELNKLEMLVVQQQLQLEMARDAEQALWSDLWATPQAVMWEEAHADRQVAQYVRLQIRAEQGDLKAAPEARQLSDRLGLNPLALLRLRAEIERVDEAEQRGTRCRATPSSSSSKKPPDDPRSVLSVVS